MSRGSKEISKDFLKHQESDIKYLRVLKQHLITFLFPYQYLVNLNFFPD